MKGENGSCSKKRKNDEEANGMEKKKKKVGIMVYTPEDEILILQGMIDAGFTNAKKELCISLEGKLSGNFSNSQLSDKIRRLKEKFFKNEHFVPLNKHEALLFELCNKIWGEGKSLIDKGASLIKKKKRKLADGEDSAKNKMREEFAYFLKKLELKVKLAKLDYEQM